VCTEERSGFLPRENRVSIFSDLWLSSLSFEERAGVRVR
jgi:hypothetical protein